MNMVLRGQDLHDVGSLLIDCCGWGWLDAPSEPNSGFYPMQVP